MSHPLSYSPGERAVLWTLGVTGAVAINGVFLYGLVVRPDLLGDALANPVSLAFIVEALALMCVFAWLLGKWGVSRLSRGWFIALSLLGSMALALPVVLLWKRER